MKQCARAIVIKDGNILLMKRFKVDREYYTLLGGGINPGEDPGIAAQREVREESGVVITNMRLVYIEEAGDPYGPQYVFLCDYVSGEPQLQADSEEAFWNVPGKNTYEPLWFPFDKLETVPFVSPLLREALVAARSHGFPDTTQSFSSKNAERLS